jgi:hypothetical protein
MNKPMTEREQFEAHWVRDVPKECRQSALAEMKANRNAEGGYERDEIDWAWEAWQASRRAALEAAAAVLVGLGTKSRGLPISPELAARQIRALSTGDTNNG